MDIRKKQGLTLFETLLAVILLMAVSIGIIYWILEYKKNVEARTLGKEVVSIVTAFDKRIHVDGFDLLYFKNGTTWKTNPSFLQMLNSEFIAKDAACGLSNGWVPRLEMEKKSHLIPCNMWKQVPWSMEAEGNIIPDGTGYVKDFYVLLSFKNEDDFVKHFKYLNVARQTMVEADSSNITGGHQYYFVKRTDPDVKITNMACFKLKQDCALKAMFNREGGYEYLRVDGTNQMIDSTVTFTKAKNQSRLQCNRWKQTLGTDTYTQEAIDCGIGIYKDTEYPIAVQANIDYSNQKKVLLDKLCTIYAQSGATYTAKIYDTGKKTPCGLLNINGSTEIYQVSDKASIKDGYILNLTSDQIVSKDVNTTFAHIYENLTVDGRASIGYSLNVGTDIYAGQSIGAGDSITAARDVRALRDLSAANKTTTNQLDVKGGVIKVGDMCFKPRTLQGYYESWGATICELRTIKIDMPLNVNVSVSVDGKSGGGSGTGTGYGETQIADCTMNQVGDRSFFVEDVGANGKDGTWVNYNGTSDQAWARELDREYQPFKNGKSLSAEGSGTVTRTNERGYTALFATPCTF